MSPPTVLVGFYYSVGYYVNSSHVRVFYSCVCVYNKLIAKQL